MRRKSAYKMLSDMAYSDYGKIIRLSPRQRGAALKALAKLTSTNCGWCIWDMRHVFAEFVDMASSRRERNARKRAAARVARTKGKGR